MTGSQLIELSGANWHRQRGPWRRRMLLVAAVVPVLCVLVFAGQIVSRAAGADEDKGDASSSPSDVAPAPGQPAPDVAETPPECEQKTCRRGRVRCRPRRRCFSRSRRSCLSRGLRSRGCASNPGNPGPYAWKDLFDGKTLKGWKTPEFGGEGEVHVKDGTIVMEMGSSMTGITWTGDVPRDNYEVAWEAARLDGIDFFAAATFPVGKDYCSFVTGGWGGTVVGLSCVDYYDASDNPTTKFHDFKDKQWYKFRVRVTPAKIEAWIGDEQVVNQQRKGHKISIRDECDLCRPLGISAWVTKSGVRKIRLRKLKPTAAKAEEPKQE